MLDAHRLPRVHACPRACLAPVESGMAPRVETRDALFARRNVRDYADRPITAEQLDQVLESGRRAPSSQNRQPWDFVAVTERDRLQELAKVWHGAGHVVTSAATIALVIRRPDDGTRVQSLYYDLGQATISMMIAAADMGIGSGHAGVADQDLARRVLGLPDDRLCAYLIALGFPANRPLTPIARPDRRPFDDVVHRERW